MPKMLMPSGLRTLRGRDRSEPHRTSTPLELLFDLCFVVAVAQAATVFHEEIGADHVRHAVAAYMTVFFAIWWAWLNFTWFASAYDTDDVAYRLMTFLQIVGVLILASGVRDAFDGNFTVITIGYVVMRLALTLQWLRAAASDDEGRRTALRYVLALAVIQGGWLLRLMLPLSWGYVTFLVLVVAELSGPYWAEHTSRSTSWHPEHIAERYGLFTIIVLGECVLSAFVAIDAARTANGISARLAVVAGAGLVSMFGIWWIYFQHSAEHMLRHRSHLSFVWGYGHYFFFAAIAALGGGLAAVAGSSSETHSAGGQHHALGDLAQTLILVVPLAIALLLLALMRAMFDGKNRVADIAAYASVVCVLVAGALAGAIGLVASLCIVAAVVVVRVGIDIPTDHRSAAEVSAD